MDFSQGSMSNQWSGHSMLSYDCKGSRFGVADYLYKLNEGLDKPFDENDLDTQEVFQKKASMQGVEKIKIKHNLDS